MKKAPILLIILVAAFLVRAVGLNYGLPFVYHDDEPIIVNYGLAYAGGDFNPRAFRMSPFLSYVLFFLYGLFFLIGYIFRYFGSVNDFAYLYLDNPTVFYLIGRAVFGLCCGTASVALLYFVAKRYFNRTTAVSASLFFAFNYLHVRDSHYLYFDIPLTFFILLFFLKADIFFKAPIRRLDYAYLGIIFGLACSVKYSGALLAAPFIMVILYNLYLSKSKGLSVKIKDLLSCGLSLIAMLFILNPFAFLDFSRFREDVLNLPFIPTPAHFHLKVSLMNGCGAAVVALGIIGMLWSVLVRRNKQVILAGYAIFYYWVINTSSQAAERLVMPLVPILLMFAASFVSDIRLLIKPKAAYYTITPLLVVGLIWPSLIRVYYSDTLFLKEDTRTQAYHWIKENIKEDTRIALDATSSWFPRLEKNRGQIEELADYLDAAQFDKPRGSGSLKIKFMLTNPDYPEKTYRIFYLKEEPEIGFLSTHPGIPIRYSELRSNQIQYVVLSNILIQDKQSSFVKELERHFRLIKTFSPYKQGIEKINPDELSTVPAAAFMLKELKTRETYGPVIRIYRLGSVPR